MTDTFRYRPLSGSASEIRLLEIQPSSKLDDPVLCLLRHVKLHDVPDYNALSYAWGDPDNTDEIWVSYSSEYGEITLKSMEITRNLKAALKRLRHRTRTFVVWADALCIDQANISEKEIQIPKMGAIYSQAMHVYLWLGEWHESTDDPDVVKPPYEANVRKAFNYIRRLSKTGICEGTSTDPLKAKSGDESLHPESDGTYSGLYSIWNREVLSRLWVVQELCLAGTEVQVLCGDEVTTLQASANAVQYINKRAIDNGSSEQQIQTLRAYWLVRAWQTLRPALGSFDDLSKVEQIIHAMRQTVGSFRFKLRQDVLYGILGLIESNEEAPDVLKPDYQKDISIFYLDLACFLTQETGTAVIIDAAARNKKTLEGLPSWAPHWDWDWRGVEPRDLRLFRSNEVAISADRTRLHLSCVDLGNLQVVSQLKPTEVNDPDKLWKRLIEILTVLKRKTCITTGAHDPNVVETKFVHLLINFGVLHAVNSNAFQILKGLLSDETVNDKSHRQPRITSEVLTISNSLISLFQNYATSYFFTTEGGTIGISVKALNDQPSYKAVLVPTARPVVVEQKESFCSVHGECDIGEPWYPASSMTEAHLHVLKHQKLTNLTLV